MPSEGRATREGLLAVLVLALVRALARMDASMAGQGAAVAEGLEHHVSCCAHCQTTVSSSLLPCHTAHIDEASRPCAHVGGQ
jgi:hypothetical protein